MEDRSRKSKPTNSKGSLSATSSQASAAGPTPSTSQDGPEAAPSGREAARANRSAWPGDRVWSTTPAICGPLFEDSYQNVSLLLSSANKSPGPTAGDGSQPRSWTCDPFYIGFGLIASTLEHSGHDSGEGDGIGWPSPEARMWRDLSDNGKAYAAQRAQHQPSTVTRAYLHGYTSQQIPALLCGLMGYPVAWLLALVSAMQSSRKSPRNS